MLISKQLTSNRSVLVNLSENPIHEVCEYTVFAENLYERKWYIDFFGYSKKKKKNENENNINTIPTTGMATSYYVTTFYSSFVPPLRVFKTARIIIIYYTRTVPERDGNERKNVYMLKTERLVVLNITAVVIR